MRCQQQGMSTNRTLWYSGTGYADGEVAKQATATIRHQGYTMVTIIHTLGARCAVAVLAFVVHMEGETRGQVLRSEGNVG